jgi:hypothetical protein
VSDTVISVHDAAHEALRTQGWFTTTSAALLGSSAAGIINELAGYLRDDHRGEGKQHARDVITYSRRQLMSLPSVVRFEEADNVAHIDGTDDYSRFLFLDLYRGNRMVAAILGLIPDEARRDSGMVSVDLFRYGNGTWSAPHHDSFGEFIAIWVLRKTGTGGENSLIRPDLAIACQCELNEDDILIFREASFLHGLSPVNGQRDALIFVVWKE